MLKRIITAIVAIAIFVPICIFSDYIVFPIAISALSVIGVYEMAKCVGQHKKWALTIPMYILAALIPMSRFFLLHQSHFFMLAMISIFFMLIYSLAYVMFGKNKEKISDRRKKI
jgi:CDP-diglyceride synthetase